MSQPVRIYHNPQCSKSRATLALLIAAGTAPEVVDYLSAPPDTGTLAALAAALPGGARDMLRTTGLPPGQAEALARADEATILATIAADPRLLNRPIVATPRGTALCRPPEAVLGLLPPDQAARARDA